MKKNIFKNGKNNFNLLDSGIGEFVYLVLQYLIIAVLYIAISLGLPRGAVLNEVASFFIEIGFLATVLIVSAVSGANFFKATKLNSKPKSYQMWFTVLIAVIAYFGFSALTNSFIDLLDLIGYKSMAGSIEVNCWWRYLLYVFTMAAVPAFCEELLFRGVVYQGLRNWSKVGAIFVSAALFMLMHGSPDQTVHQFVLGVVLALLFNATGTIWCPMLLHFLNNFIALTLSFIFSMAKIDTTTTVATETATETEGLSAYGPWMMWVTALVSALTIAIIAGLLIWFIVKYLKKRNFEESGVAEPVITKTDDGRQIVDIPVLNSEIAQNVDNENIKKPEKYNTVSLVLFVLAGIWVSIEWIQTLITGLLK